MPILRHDGFEADIAAAQAKAVLARGVYAVMTLDFGHPDRDGVALIRELQGQRRPPGCC